MKYFRSVIALVLAVVLMVGMMPMASADIAGNIFAEVCNKVFVKTGQMSYAELEAQRDRINGINKGLAAYNDIGNSLLSTASGGAKIRDYCGITEIRYMAVAGAPGMWVLYDTTNKRYWDGGIDGRFPYALCDDDHPAPSGSSGSETSFNVALDRVNNKWTDLIKISKGVQVTSLTSLSEKRDKLYANDTSVRISKTTIGTTKFYVIFRSVGGKDYIYTDVYGSAFAAPVEEKSSVTNVDFDYNHYEATDNGVVVGGDNSGEINTGDSFSQVVDLANGTFGGVHWTGDFNEGDSHYHNEHLLDLYWNGNNYEITTGDLHYNYDNRKYEYVTNNYYVTYNITNTYIQYIGSSAEFTPTEYKLYYELPDGRSSADLTADEVAALSFQFYDCLNYERSATDINMRALYHFDGDLSDSSYFSDVSTFTWAEGGSVTYMDSSTFDGALYLDERAHKFTMRLPSSIRAGDDFTIQFRHYQASQPDTLSNVENSLSLGSTKLISWDERNLYSGSTTGNAVCQLPIGNWSELAVIRNSGVIYIYVNGVKVGSYSNNAAFARELTFTLGNTSRAYTMLDELRVVDFALAQAGANYTPTSVPYDSNLVLVLPGEGETAAEWFEFTDPNQPISNANFTEDDFALGAFSSSAPLPVGQWVMAPISGYATTDAYVNDDCVTIYNGTNYSGTWLDSYGSQTPSASGFACVLADSTHGTSQAASGLSGLLSSSSSSLTYTMVVVLKDGTLCTLPFNTRSQGFQSSSFSWGKLTYRYGVSSAGRIGALYIVPDPGKSIDVVYAGVVLGTDPFNGWNYTKHSGVLKGSTVQANTAAVQTDIPITGYTVGGVRPTFPQRGNVWFGVTAGRVSSVQVYTGNAWESANARWWTGSRWIPIYAFDIFTLEDCWDVADADDVITPIETETQGWNWWKSAWYDFREWFKEALPSLGGDPDPVPTPSPAPVTSTFTLLGSDQDGLPFATIAGLNDVRMGTSDYFTVHYSEQSKLITLSGPWPDGYRIGPGVGVSGTGFNLGGGFGGSGGSKPGKYGVYNSIEFTTFNPATVKVWWAPGDNRDRQLCLYDTSFSSVGDPDISGDYYRISSFDVSAAGTYYLGTPREGVYIAKVEVVEAGPHPFISPDDDRPGQQVVTSHTLLSSRQTTNAVLLARIASLVDSGKNADLQYNAKSSGGYVAWGGGLHVPMGTGNYFTVHYSGSAKADFSAAKEWSDGFSAGEDYARFNFGGNVRQSKENSIEFTTTGSAVVKVWWVPGGDGRQLGVYAGDADYLTVSSDTKLAKKNEPLLSYFDLTNPGRYLLGSVSNNSYIYKVEVVESVYKEPAPTVGTNPGDNYDDGEPDILDDPLQDEDGEDVSIFGLAGLIAKNLWKVVKGLFSVVLGGVTGLFSLIGDGIGGFFDAFTDDLNPYSFSTYGGADIWD